MQSHYRGYRIRKIMRLELQQPQTKQSESQGETIEIVVYPGKRETLKLNFVSSIKFTRDLALVKNTINYTEPIELPI